MADPSPPAIPLLFRILAAFQSVYLLIARLFSSKRGVAVRPATNGGKDEVETVDGVIITGAGIAGLAAAGALHKIGIPVLVLERSEGLPVGGTVIGTWSNAFRCLERLGLAEQLRKSHPVSSTRTEICSPTKVLKSVVYDQCPGGPHEVRSLRRHALLQAMGSVLPKSAIRFNTRVVDAQLTEEGGACVTLDNGKVIKGRCVIGCDGVWSAVVSALGVRPASYVGYCAIRGIAQFPKGTPSGNHSRLIYGSGVKVGIMPVSETEAYYIIVFNVPQVQGDKRMSQDDIWNEALSKVSDMGWEAVELVKHTPKEALVRSRINDRWQVPGTTIGQGCISLAGDAWHPFTMNLGQGGCVAMEDGVVVARYIASAWRKGDSASLAAALRNYEVDRGLRACALVLRSHFIGILGKLTFPPLVALRNFLIANVMDFSNFMDHTTYDCGDLPVLN